MGKYLIIPDMERLEESICLAKEYDLGFEVNDFFEPNLQKEPERKEILIQRYTECERREPFTMQSAAWKKESSENLGEILHEAEMAMYADKAAFYKASGIERRK